MKNILTLLSVSILLCLLFASCGKSSNQSDKQGSFSPVGVYRADLTIMQSGSMTTIVLKEDGSATMQQDGYDVEYYSWNIGYDGKSVELDVGEKAYWMDFSSGYMYYGIDNYKSKNPNRRYKFIKIR